MNKKTLRWATELEQIQFFSREPTTSMAPVYVIVQEPVYVPVVVSQSAATTPVLDVPSGVTKPNCAERVTRMPKSKPEVSIAQINVGKVSRIDQPHDPYLVFRKEGDWDGRLLAAWLIKENARRVKPSSKKSTHEYQAALMIRSSLYQHVPFGTCRWYTGKEKRVYRAGFADGFRELLHEIGGDLYDMWESIAEKAEYDADF